MMVQPEPTEIAAQEPPTSAEPSAWRPQAGEFERRYPERTPLPPGYRVIWHEGTEHYLWITEDGWHESDVSCRHWDCWRGAWAHYRNQPQRSKGRNPRQPEPRDEQMILAACVHTRTEQDT